MIKNIFVLFILFFTCFGGGVDSFAVGKAMVNQAKEIADKNNLNFVNDEENTSNGNGTTEVKSNENENNMGDTNNTDGEDNTNNKNNTDNTDDTNNKTNNTENKDNTTNTNNIDNINNTSHTSGNNTESTTNTGGTNGNKNNMENTNNTNNTSNTNNIENTDNKAENKENLENTENNNKEENDDYNFLRMVLQEFKKINPNENKEVAGKKLADNLRKRFREEIFNVNSREEFEKRLNDLKNEMKNLSKLSTNVGEFDPEELEKIKKIFESEVEVESFIPPYSANYYKDFTSFMFPTKNINLIRKVLEVYNKNNSMLNRNNMLNNAENEEESYDMNVGNVYLKSIMYISKNYWAVWINDKKISNENNNDEDNEFYIKRVDRNTAEIQWRVSKAKWSIINYENTIDKSHYNINEETNKVEFDMKLHPNQTFVISANKIIDGKYRPIIKKSDGSKITDKHLESIMNGEDIDLDLLTN